MIQNNTIGIDVGGTKTAMGLVNNSGKLVSKVEFQTENTQSFQHLLDEIIAGFKKLKVDKIEKIGVGIAGQIDSKTGIIVHSPNISRWKNIPVAKTLESKLGFEFKKSKKITVKIANDANCFTLAEATYGAGKGFSSVVGITLGTGVGGGLILNGQMYQGQGFASEPGHMIVKYGGRKCSCGQEGCLEAYASGTSIENEYYKKTKQKKSALEIEKEAMDKGTKSVAYKIYQNAGEYLGVGISNLVNILDPDLIVIGGGLGKSELLFRLAKKETTKNVFFKKRKIEIKKAKLGKDAGVVGAAELAR